MHQRETDINRIKTLLIEKDSEGVNEDAYHFIHVYSRDEEILLLLCQIFDADWHKSHEDMARAFQGASNPVTAETLFKVALTEFEYSWNDNYPLQRKCTWALADIGTDEARNFLEQIKQKANEEVAEFADKRLRNWDSEFRRKGQILSGYEMHSFFIPLEKYSESLKTSSIEGQKIIGNQFTKRSLEFGDYYPLELVEVITEYVLLYQIHKREVADHSVKDQKFTDPENNSLTINPIKVGFLSMLYSGNWLSEENQERMLAIWIKKEAFAEILKDAVLISENESQKQIERKKVILHWLPDNDCLGKKLERKVIQLDLNSEAFEKLVNEKIEGITDITDFVLEQKNHIDKGELDRLLIPKESVIQI
jgi:hypothetical protein